MNTRFYITHKVNKSREVGFAFCFEEGGFTFVVFAFVVVLFVITVVTLVAFTSQ